MKKVLKNNLLLVIIICFILASLIIIPNIIIGKGVYTLAADLNIQQIPFNIAINDSLKQGSYLWCWFNGLGSNYLATFSFYNLLSPFNIIGYLFPASFFKYLKGPIFILKYVVAGITSYLFLQRHVKNKKYAVLGAVLYSFSGFQFTNTLFYHFHDIVALFPLLLYTLDNYWYDNKKFKFMLSVFLLAVTNWFFFIGEVVFLLLYFFVNVICKKYIWNLKKFGHLFLESVLGVGLACFILIPSLFFTLGNPRVDNGWVLKDMLIYNYKSIYLDIVRSFLLPNQIMGNRDLISNYNWCSTEMFLPFVGIILSTSYVYKNKKDSYSILFLILLCFMFIPILNSSFFAFTTNYYSRWFYLFIIVNVLLSIKCLDNNISVKPGLIFSVILFVGLLLSFVIYYIIIGNSLILNVNSFLLYIIIFVLYIFLFYFYNHKFFKYTLFISICLFIIIWGNFTTFKFKNSLKTDYSYLNYLDDYKDAYYDKKYRTNTYNINYNIGYLNGSMNMMNWNSNINKEEFDFYNSLDYYRSVATIIDVLNKDLNSFLSIKYIYSSKDSDLSQYGYQLYDEFDNYNIYVNNEVKDFGFVLNKYISKDEFLGLSTDEKYIALFNSYILNDEQIDKYGNLILKNGKIISNNYEFLNNGFKAEIEVKGDVFLIYTIPCDNGWKIKVNGNEVEYENIDNGLIGLRIENGINEIEFSYFPKGLKLGLLISGVSLLTAMVLYLIDNRRKNEK